MQKLVYIVMQGWEIKTQKQKTKKNSDVQKNNSDVAENLW